MGRYIENTAKFGCLHTGYKNNLLGKNSVSLYSKDNFAQLLLRFDLRFI